MNETRGNSRTKPMRGGLIGGEINSLKDSEKTNEYNYIKIGIIHNFDELYKIQTKASETTATLDLMLIRKFYFLVDVCLFIIGADASECLEYYYMSHKDYYKLKTSQKEYIEHYY